MNLANYFNAGYPLVAIAAADENQATAELIAAAGSVDRNVFFYSAAGQILNARREPVERLPFPAAFQWVAAMPGALLIVFDCQSLIGNAAIIRAIIDAADSAKMNGTTIALVAPGWQLPAELRHRVPVVELSLPNREQLAEPLAVVAESAGVALNGNRELLLDSAAGLTVSEAENAFALSLVESGALNPAIVQREKMRLIRATGFLSVEQPAALSDIGGLEQLKNYLVSECAPVARDSQLAVRGILLAGIPGTGKSLAARSCGAALGWPVLRLDIPACKGGLVGQSESNIRAATALVEAIAPAVLWIDELEKSVSGWQSSGQTDGGTSSGMLGHLLTWLQEHRAPVLTVATCNDFQALPPELTRAGRFDERFAVDMPTEPERVAIATIHLARLGCSVELAERVAAMTAEYTGAEIEQLVKSAARLSARNIDAATLERCAASIRPIAKVSKKTVDGFREWARLNMRPANTAEQLKPARRAALAAAPVSE